MSTKDTIKRRKMYVLVIDSQVDLEHYEKRVSRRGSGLLVDQSTPADLIILVLHYEKTNVSWTI